MITETTRCLVLIILVDLSNRVIASPANFFITEIVNWCCAAEKNFFKQDRYISKSYIPKSLGYYSIYTSKCS